MKQNKIKQNNIIRLGRVPEDEIIGSTPKSYEKYPYTDVEFCLRQIAIFEEEYKKISNK